MRYIKTYEDEANDDVFRMMVGSYWTQYFKSWGNIQKIIMKCKSVDATDFFFDGIKFSVESIEPIKLKDVENYHWTAQRFVQLYSDKSKVDYDNANFEDTLTKTISYVRQATEREIEKFLRAEKAMNARTTGSKFDL